MGKYVVLMVFLCCTCSILKAQDLDQYRWENRLLLLFAPQQEAPQLKQQLKILAAEEEGLHERKLEIITITPATPINQQYYKDYKVAKDEWTVILLGLDGGEKLRQKELLTTRKLFALIDGMPMRRAEMRRKKSN